MDRYINLRLMLTELGGGRFQARLLHEEKASPEAVNFGWSLNDTLAPDSALTYSGSLAKINSLAIQPTELEKLGRALYQLAFKDPIGATFQAWYQDRNNGDRFRLRIDVAAGDLDALPWEVLWDGSGFLARSEVSIVRFSDQARKQDLKLAPPLRGLIVSAAPQSHTFDEESYVQPVEEAMTECGISVQSLTGGASTYAALHESLTNQKWDFFHFVGHGKFEDGAGKLILPDEQGGKDELDSSDLANWIAQAGVKFAFLCSCKTGMTDSSHPFRGVARALVHQGLPGLVAMQFNFPQDDARLFVNAFYRSLLSGCQIDQAMAYARSDLTYAKVAWCIPALYSQFETATLTRGKAENAQPDLTTLKQNIDLVDTAWEQMDCYKEIHSALHNLEMVCCAAISMLVKEVLNDAGHTAWTSRESRAFMGALQEMNDWVDRIGIAASRPFVTALQKTWIDRDLIPARDSLGEAYRNVDPKKVDDGLYRFSRIFSRQPARFNDLIAESAGELETAVATLRESAEAGLPGDLSQSVLALTQIQQRLMALMSDHGKWQEVVGMVRLAELTAPTAPASLNREWAPIDELLTPLLSADDEFWCVNLRDTRARFTESLVDPRSVPEEPIVIFLDICRQSKIRFFGIDEKLKAAAKELNRLLEKISRQLEKPR
jgi:hypothetical protein